YHDMFEYSWGQYMARAAGFTAYNFSRGGMTASEYMDSFGAANGFFDKDKAAQAYIIALGVNDLYNRGDEVGEVADCETEAKTFAGYYGRLIKAYKEISPEAKFFFVTMPTEDRRNAEQMRKGDAHQKLLYDFAGYFTKSYVIDLRKYAPEYDADFRKQFFLGGHMSPAGYILTARMLLTYIDWIIRHNMQDFKQVGFIGTGIRNLTE
ncbi:MAG: SGNH/GDSL hydrolase family protein, partial [Clostridia bacterium]|nr:SGNH/GDSL hydrolase family protein [Clostridia bacterium]